MHNPDEAIREVMQNRDEAVSKADSIQSEYSQEIQEVPQSGQQLPSLKRQDNGCLLMCGFAVVGGFAGWGVGHLFYTPTPYEYFDPQGINAAAAFFIHCVLSSVMGCGFGLGLYHLYYR